MHLGIDFDNTIVCYDALFHRLAVERGFIDPATPRSKAAVRDALRDAGRENDWTFLQGFAYGPRITDAQPFPGVVAFMQSCRDRDIRLSIVSHKTHRPYRGPAYDLHEAAWTWLTYYGVVGRSTSPLTHSDVYFEPTREAKLRRISQMGVTHFVDDLPEFLTDPKFPADVIRILFDPANAYGDVALPRLTSWHSPPNDVLGAAA